MPRRFTPVVALVTLLVTNASGVSGYQNLRTSSLIREEQRVTINGQAEAWRLEWKAPPEPYGPPLDDVSFTCPYMGFAYGESGEADLVRIQNGRELERLALQPFFDMFGGSQDKVAIQRYPVESTDFDRLLSGADHSSELDRIQRRGVVRIMKFFDYDHDGRATEFFLQTDSLPCGKIAGIVLGISRTNNRLHAFASVNRPSQALVLQFWEWQELGKSSGAVRVVDWRCGDHGSEEESDLEMEAVNGDIRVRQERFECLENGKLGPRVSSEER